MSTETEILLLTILVPALTPMVVWLTVRVIGNLPKWLVPLIALVAGGLIQGVEAALSGAIELSVPLGILLGGAGVAVREIYDQLASANRAVADDRPVPRML